MSETNKKTFDDLLNIMRVQAKVFLDEMGEFFPYGSVLTNKQTIDTLGLYNDEKELTVTEGIDILSNYIIKSIQCGDILIGAIGIDVVISNSKESGLMIKATEDGIKWHERTYAYQMINGECVWK
ncbi:MAG: hypothetical protein DI588_07090 [Flavobacterium johnsoniae]|nr:MAG: hypothetical protein DI588_07090 [Flavobacterium johnsoniae]